MAMSWFQVLGLVLLVTSCLQFDHVMAQDVVGNDTETEQNVTLGPDIVGNDTETEQNVTLGPDVVGNDTETEQNVTLGPDVVGNDTETEQNVTSGPDITINIGQNYQPFMITGPPKDPISGSGPRLHVWKREVDSGIKKNTERTDRWSELKKWMKRNY